MNENRLRRAPAAAGLGLLACLAAGCGGYGSVSGKVTYNGQPLGGGTVVFYVEGQGNGSSEIGPDGTYKIDKMPIGTAKVAVETASVKPAAPDPRRPAMPAPPAGQTPAGANTSFYDTQGKPKGAYVAIPESYADYKTSGLSCEIKPGPQKKDFDLK